MNRIWCGLLFLLMWPVARSPSKSQQCYVPVCGVYGPGTASDCPFLTLDIFSGSWNASWAKPDSERPENACSSEQLDTFFKTFPILETPMKQLGGNTIREGDSMVVRGALHLLKHYWHYCANWVITFVPEEWRPSPHVLFWFAVVTFFIRIGLDVLVYLASLWAMILSIRQMLCSIISIFYWAQVFDRALFWWVRRTETGQNHERPEAENVQIQELGEKNRILESLELRTETLEQKLEAQLTIQQTLDSEHDDKESKVNDVIRSQRLKIQALEQDLKTTESLFKTEMICHGQQMEETLTHVRITVQSLEAERKESAFLRQKLIEVSDQLEEMNRPVFVTSVKEGNEALAEGQTVQTKEKNNLEGRNKRALERLRGMRGQRQWKDQVLQQKVAQVESERRDRELRVKALLRSHKQKVQEIEEQHLRAELSHNAEIESLKKESQGSLAKAYTSECELTSCKEDMNIFRKQLDELQGALFGSTLGRSHQQTTRNETSTDQTIFTWRDCGQSSGRLNLEGGPSP